VKWSRSKSGAPVQVTEQFMGGGGDTVHLELDRILILLLKKRPDSDPFSEYGKGPDPAFGNRPY
jgi:hypothetical protein